MPSPSESEYSPSLGSLGKASVLSGFPSPSVSALFGFVPLAYSCALLNPSPSGSAFPSPPLVGLRPLATSHPSGNPSPSESGLFIFVPAFCSSELVRPSPSQSAPPSEGSSGSLPSAPTTLSDRMSIIAVIIVHSVLFIFFEIICVHKLGFKDTNCPSSPLDYLLCYLNIRINCS